jgi:hypothetical protein
MNIKVFISKNKIGIFLFFLVALNIFLRVYKLNIRPVWYGDEGSNLEIAWNLIHGKLVYLAYDYTFLPHLPLFFLLAGIFALLFGHTILAIRLFAVLCVTIVTVLLYFLGKEVRDKKTGVLASLIFTILYAVLLFSRYAFFPNLLVLEITLVALFSVKYLKTKEEKWLWGVTASLATISLSEVYVYAIFLVLPFLLWQDKKKLLRYLAFSLTPLAIFILAMLILKSQSFIADGKYYFIYRYALPNNPHENPLLDYFRLMKMWMTGGTLWGSLGFLGLFLIKDKKIRWLIGSIALITFLSVLAPNLRSFFARNLLIVYPFAALGAALLVQKIFELVMVFFNAGKKSFLKAALAIIFISFTFKTDILSDIRFFGPKPYSTTQDLSYYDLNVADVKAASNFINENTEKDELVIAPDQFAPMIQAKMANFFQATAFDGIENDIYSPRFIDKRRFLFNASLKDSKYLILEEESLVKWGNDVPTLRPSIEDVFQWPIVFSSKNYEIRENPSYLKND